MLTNKGKAPIDFTSYVVEHTRDDFADREWVFQEVNDWLAKYDGARFFLLTGEPGSGKTVIVSHLVQFSRKQVPPGNLTFLDPNFLSATHFCSARDSRWIDPHTFAESLALQLAERYPTYAQTLAAQSGDRQIVIKVDQQIENMTGGQVAGVVIKELDVSAVSPETAFNRVVREPLETLYREGFDQRVVILVDALDEALLSGEKQNIISLLARINYMPTGVRFIITTRPEIKVLSPLRQSSVEEHSLTLGVGLTRSKDDVQRYVLDKVNTHPELRKKLVPVLEPIGFAETMREKSKGNFLYVKYLLENLEKQEETVTKELLNTLPEGLDGIYLEFLGRVVGNDQHIWEEKYGLIAGTLAVAQEPLTEKQVANFVNTTESKVRGSLVALRQLLEVDDSLPASRRTYTIYHRSFADFLLDEDRSENYWCQAEEQHKRIVDFYRGKAVAWDEVNWSNVDNHGLRHITFHLLKGYQDGLAL